MRHTETSSYKEVRKLVRSGYKIGVIVGVDRKTIYLQKTDWLSETKDRTILTNYDGEPQMFYVDNYSKYVEFKGMYV